MPPRATPGRGRGAAPPRGGGGPARGRGGARGGTPVGIAGEFDHIGYLDRS